MRIPQTPLRSGLLKSGDDDQLLSGRGYRGIGIKNPYQSAIGRRKSTRCSAAAEKLIQ
jgi:hypothetical protein